MTPVRYVTHAYFQDALTKRERMEALERHARPQPDGIEDLASWVILGILITACAIVWGVQP